MAYMGIVSALKILSVLQRHILHLCEHGHGHNFVTNSNGLIQLLTAPAVRVPSDDLSSHSPPLHLFDLILKATLQQSSEVTTPETPA